MHKAERDNAAGPWSLKTRAAVVQARARWLSMVSVNVDWCQERAGQRSGGGPPGAARFGADGNDAPRAAASVVPRSGAGSENAELEPEGITRLDVGR